MALAVSHAHDALRLYGLSAGVGSILVSIRLSVHYKFLHHRMRVSARVVAATIRGWDLQGWMSYVSTIAHDRTGLAVVSNKQGWECGFSSTRLMSAHDAMAARRMARINSQVLHRPAPPSHARASHASIAQRRLRAHARQRRQ